MIVGLGNPGTQYRNTRHNIGFEVIDRILQRLGVTKSVEKHQGVLAEAFHEGGKLILIKPMTFMNRSGDCVAPAARNRIFEPQDVLVVTDDVNLPLGRMRVRSGGSAGGHNGLKSIIERLGTQDFHRLRLGVGANDTSRDLADHVLSKFRPDERAVVEEMVVKAVDAALLWASAGVERVMNAYN